MRAARSKIFHARQQKLQQWNRERDSTMAEAHEAAQRQIEEAKAALQGQTNAAQRTLQDSIDELAGDILEAILPKNRAMPRTAVERVR